MENISIQSTATSFYFITTFSYLGIDHRMLSLYTFLLLIDFITWVIKGYLNKNIQSSIAINGIFKKFVLIFLIFAVAITWKIVWYENVSQLLGVAFSVLAVSELYSILANIFEIRTGNKAKEFDWVSFFISNALKIIEWKIKKLDYKKDENEKN